MNQLIIMLIFFMTNLDLDKGQYAFSIENLLKIAIGAFSLLLLALSISAYRRTGIRKVIYAVMAFALFAAQLFIDYIQDNIEFIPSQDWDIIFYAMTLAILILFFLALIKRK